MHASGSSLQTSFISPTPILRPNADSIESQLARPAPEALDIYLSFAPPPSVPASSWRAPLSASTPVRGARTFSFGSAANAARSLMDSLSGPARRYFSPEARHERLAAQSRMTYHALMNSKASGSEAASFWSLLARVESALDADDAFRASPLMTPFDADAQATVRGDLETTALRLLLASASQMDSKSDALYQLRRFASRLLCNERERVEVLRQCLAICPRPQGWSEKQAVGQVALDVFSMETRVAFGRTPHATNEAYSEMRGNGDGSTYDIERSSQVLHYSGRLFPVNAVNLTAYLHSRDAFDIYCRTQAPEHVEGFETLQELYGASGLRAVPRFNTAGLTDQQMDRLRREWPAAFTD